MLHLRTWLHGVVSVETQCRRRFVGDVECIFYGGKRMHEKTMHYHTLFNVLLNE